MDSTYNPNNHLSPTTIKKASVNISVILENVLPRGIDSNIPQPFDWELYLILWLW